MTQVTQEQALEAVQQVDFCLKEFMKDNVNISYVEDAIGWFKTLSQYIEGRELFIPCPEGTAPAISRAT